MPYRVEFTPRAEREFDRLHRQLQDRLRPHIRALADDPGPPGAEKLTDRKNGYRIRIGDYCVLYAIRDEVLVALVFRGAHRGRA